jgi:FtsP/CotA-like multicopper oxidase with cupredoxin domain
MSNGASRKRKLRIISASISLVAIVLLGFLASSMFSVNTPIAPSPSGGNVPLGPEGIAPPMGCYGAAGIFVIDPPPGQPFKDPILMEDTNPDPNIFECNLESKMADININGVTANLHTYNGYYPAPTIQIKQGDILKVHFKNSFPNVAKYNLLGFREDVVNVHTHGFHVSPKEPSDNPDILLEPGQTYNYEYDSSMAPAGGTSWYHSHVHGRTAELLDMAGTLLVEDDTDLLANVETHIIFIKDIAMANGSRAPYFHIMEYVMGKEGNLVLVNGQVNPVLDIQPGEVQRWKVVNSCSSRFIRLSLEGHMLNLIGADSGGLLDQPYAVPEVLLSPSERVDILVKANQTSGTYKLLSLPYLNGCGNPAELVTLMTLNYKGATVNDSVPATLKPNAERVNMDLSNIPVKRFILSMTTNRGLINGYDFDIYPLTVTSTVGTYEIWEISAQCMMDHCFHMHINHFQVLSVIGGDPSYGLLYSQIPAWKDTVYIPRGGVVRILVNVADFTGMTMFHCHIVEHEDIGMMGMWDIQPANSSMTMG